MATRALVPGDVVTHKFRWTVVFYPESPWYRRKYRVTVVDEKSINGNYRGEIPRYDRRFWTQAAALEWAKRKAVQLYGPEKVSSKRVIQEGTVPL